MIPGAEKKAAIASVSNLTLLACGIAQLQIFVFICALSQYFDSDSPGLHRPLIFVLSLFGLSFVFYAWAWKAVGGFSARRFARKTCTKKSLMIVIFFGLLFRVAMLPSMPIQEIDVFRYIWDGAVVSTRTDPYLYSPAIVLNTVNQTSVSSGTIMTESPAGVSDDLKRIVGLLEQRPGLKYALNKTHFGQYTTPYPPVSQLVFGATVSLVPADSGHRTYMFAMKGALLLFDVGTGFVIVWLLGHLGFSQLLSLGYWWCPLVIKEISNSGHLDSIVVFFSTLAVCLAAKAFWPLYRTGDTAETNSVYFNWPFAIGSAVVLGVAIAAKIVPIVLVPIWLIASMRRRWFGSIAMVLILLATTTVLMWPMARHLESTRRVFEYIELDIPFAEELSDEGQGIEAFSRYWEMNDFIFMLLVENLKPEPVVEDIKGEPANAATSEDLPWFAVTSNDFRKRAAEAETTRNASNKPSKLAPSHPYFSLSRKITLAIFGLCVLVCCISVFRNRAPENWLENIFLCFAWFWLLAPTQNPWYWLWALPLISFARGRVWFFMSGLLFLYYSRFWFEHHFTGVRVLNTPYSGTTFFDFVITWIEYAPWLCMLFLCWAYRSAKYLVGSSRPLT